MCIWGSAKNGLISTAEPNSMFEGVMLGSVGL